MCIGLQSRVIVILVKCPVSRFLPDRAKDLSAPRNVKVILVKCPVSRFLPGRAKDLSAPP
jgi:hypothetical protein